MTITERKATHDQRPRWKVFATLGAAVTLTLLTVTAWILLAAQQRSHVAIWFDALPLGCDGSPPAIEGLEIGEDPVYVHMVDLSPEFDCQLRLHIDNRGRLPATSTVWYYRCTVQPAVPVASPAHSHR